MVPRRPRRRSLIALGCALAAELALDAVLSPPEAWASPLPPEDVDRLARGEVVTVPLDVDLPQGSYFGGVAYAVVNAPVSDVAAVLNDPTTYRSILPMTLDARVVDRGDGVMRIWLRQGGRAGSGAYVLFVRRESQGLLRFWLDPSAPHDIADLWGYFRVQPWRQGSSLLTYAALLRLDFGVVKMLFSEVIRRYALRTPGTVRAFIEGRRGHTPG
jgi:hypothetical protein